MTRFTDLVRQLSIARPQRRGGGGVPNVEDPKGQPESRTEETWVHHRTLSAWAGSSRGPALRVGSRCGCPGPRYDNESRLRRGGTAQVGEEPWPLSFA
jgi:hypothetical protein